MLQGTIIGLVGTALGYLLGVSTSLILKKYQFIKLPSDVYPMDHLPIRLDWLDLTLIGVVAFLLCFLATLYPSRQAARLKPAEALHYE
jgi:lipoprotein-releasing system permease protein